MYITMGLTGPFSIFVMLTSFLIISKFVCYLCNIMFKYKTYNNLYSWVSVYDLSFPLPSNVNIDFFVFIYFSFNGLSFEIF